MVVVEVVFVDLVINGSSGQTGIIRNPSCCTVNGIRVSAVTIYAARARTVMILLKWRGGKSALTAHRIFYPTVRHCTPQHEKWPGSHRLTKLTIKLIGSDGLQE